MDHKRIIHHSNIWMDLHQEVVGGKEFLNAVLVLSSHTFRNHLTLKW